MKNRRTFVIVRKVLWLVGVSLWITACEDSPKVIHPKDNVSQLPWDHDNPGDTSRAYGGLPQSR